MKKYTKLKIQISRIERMIEKMTKQSNIKVKCWCSHWDRWWALLIKKMKGKKQ